MKINCVGELLIDMISEDGENYQRKPGGAPSNVAVAASRLGSDVDLAATVGRDFLGDFLKEKVEQEGVGIENVNRSSRKTSLAYVKLDENKEPSFSFYRGADKIISPEQLEHGYDIVHVGSLPFTSEKTSETILEYVRETDAKVSFDPNLRKEFVDTRYLEKINEMIAHTDILFAADSELEKLGRSKTVKQVDEVIVSKGEEGADLITQDKVYSQQPNGLDPVDTTGAGDALAGAYLSFRDEGKKEALQKAVEAAEESIKSRGAMSSLPEKSDLL